MSESGRMLASDAREMFAPHISHSYAENVRHSRNNFFVMLLAQFYCLITIETTQDAALLSNSTTQKLPILETSISIETFYILAPLILLLVFFHFQIHLKSIWRSAAALAQSEGKDLMTLVDTFPWFITSSMARRFARGQRDRGGFSGWFEYNVGLLFGWFSTALVIFMIWARYLTKHDWTISIYHVALFAVAVAGAVYFMSASKANLQGVDVRGWRIASRGTAILIAFVAPAAALGYSTWWLFEAQDRNGCQNSYTAECSAIFLLRDRLRVAGLDPAAALDGADVSARPENWAPSAESDLEQLAAVRGANLRGEDLRYASAKNALFVRSDLREATLRLGDFEGAWFQGADLSGADMSFSKFVGANFDHAIFSTSGRRLGEPAPAIQRTELDPWGQPWRTPVANETVFDSADLTGASFYKARFIGGRGVDALFSGANFTGAAGQGCFFERSDFREAKLDDAAFTDCGFHEASFHGASMQRVSLSGSRLSDIIMVGAELASANLSGAKLHSITADQVVLNGGDMFQTRIDKSRFNSAQLDDVVLSEAQVFDSAFRDSALRRVDFRRAMLKGVDLSGADLSGSIFFGAKLDAVDLAFARLHDADLSGADLSSAANLTQKQLDRACGDRLTRLPAGLTVIDCAEKLAQAAAGGADAESSQ